MSDIKCNYQPPPDEEYWRARAEVICQRCGVSAGELGREEQTLEICGEEFSSDIATGERVLIPIALCPDCHREEHLDRRLQHNPCQISARLSRECLI